MHIHDETSSVDTTAPLTELGQRTRNGAARETALQVLQQQQATTTSIIEYHSDGRLVIIGPVHQAVPIAEQLLNQLSAIAIVNPGAADQHPAHDDRILLLHAEVNKVEGHLGAFQVQLRDCSKQSLSLLAILGRSWSSIDMILDLSDTPLLDAEISPPGYFATRGESDKLDTFLPEIPELVGKFEKPRYFQYDPSICVHARNQQTACTRCIDACPTLAIHSIGEQIQVDPYLCQGGGSCAAVCPSGAIQYIYPALADLLGRIRQVLKNYRQAQGHDARIIFVNAQQGEALYAQLASLEENLLPIILDELGALDLAIMLNTLSYGAQQVIVAMDASSPLRVRDTLQQQYTLATGFLTGLGYSTHRILITDQASLATLPVVTDDPIPAARYGSFSEKRTMIRLALEHLHKNAPQQLKTLPLYSQAPFGEIRVDPLACTLCLACTGVCPTRALLSGNESPQLNFIEDYCVQCGLCEQTCPENAIRRHPRYLFDEEARRARRTLYAEAPFHCISCGKPFATQRIIDRMQERLSGHWMFGNERALRRLKMCDDCRIKDLWDEQGI